MAEVDVAAKYAAWEAAGDVNQPLRLSNLRVHALPPLPALARHVRIRGCRQLLRLPEPFPPGLLTLRCIEGALTTLPPFPPTLVELYCSHNKLTTLPPLPENLVLLYCNDNALTRLPPLPLTLQYVGCWHNRLRSLPDMCAPAALHLDTHHTMVAGAVLNAAIDNPELELRWSPPTNIVDFNRIEMYRRVGYARPPWQAVWRIFAIEKHVAARARLGAALPGPALLYV
jgi:Leucine-rich repeat (LRR) protein